MGGHGPGSPLGCYRRSPWGSAQCWVQVRELRDALAKLEELGGSSSDTPPLSSPSGQGEPWLPQVSVGGLQLRHGGGSVGGIGALPVPSAGPAPVRRWSSAPQLRLPPTLRGAQPGAGGAGAAAAGVSAPPAPRRWGNRGPALWLSAGAGGAQVPGEAAGGEPAAGGRAAGVQERCGAAQHGAGPARVPQHCPAPGSALQVGTPGTSGTWFGGDSLRCHAEPLSLQ